MGSLFHIGFHRHLFGIGKLQIRGQLIIHKCINPPFIRVYHRCVGFGDADYLILVPDGCGIIIILISKIILVIGLVQAGQKIDPHQECEYQIPVRL